MLFIPVKWPCIKDEILFCKKKKMKRSQGFSEETSVEFKSDEMWRIAKVVNYFHEFINLTVDFGC